MAGYIKYEKRSDRRSLDQNTIPFMNTPRGKVIPPLAEYPAPDTLYEGVIFPPALYLTEYYPRSTDIDYIIDAERIQHPDHFSRFAYADMWNGYGVGGGFNRYKVAPGCGRFRPEADNAPKKFYSDKYVGSAVCMSQVMDDTRKY
jgi:hypothetical protein